jgi:acyl dehydratase
MKSRYYEDIRVGQKIIVGQHVVDKEGMIEFARKWDPQVFHLDEVAAGAQHNGLIASSNYTMCVVTRVIGLDWHIKTFGVMEYKEIQVHAPVRPGDVLTVSMEWVDKRESRSKPDRGVVLSRIEVRNQRDELALSYISTIMMMKRGDA